MEKLLDFLSVIPEKYLQGEKYEELLKAYNISEKDIKQKRKSNGSRDEPVKKDEAPKRKIPRSSSYKQSALDILYGLFEKQTQKYITELYAQHGSFTDTYNDLNDNKHPSGGKRRKDASPKPVSDEGLMRELDDLDIAYTTKEETKSVPKKQPRATKPKRVDSDDEDVNEDTIRKTREEFERQRKKAEENMRQAKEEDAKKKEEDAKKKEYAEETQKKYEEDNVQARYTPKLSLKPVAMKYFGVGTGYTTDEITRIWRRKSLELHPDKQGGSSEAFVLLGEYFELLKWCREHGC